jgi:hypothetical protein
VQNTDEAPLLDPRDAEFYARYLETCRRLGVEPVSLDRARELVREWSAAINAATLH